MGAWGIKTFDNDSASDWAFGLEEVEDLSLVESAFDELEATGDDYLDLDIACNALAACEVLARLRGRTGYSDSYTEPVDLWVEAHQMTPPASLVARAGSAIDRILGPDSELDHLWEETGEYHDWRDQIRDLRDRVGGGWYFRWPVN